METLIGLLFWGGIGYFVLNKLTSKKEIRATSKEPFGYRHHGTVESPGFTQKSVEEQEIEAKEIASGVKSHRGLEALQNKVDALSDKMDEYHFAEKEVMYKKTEEKQTIMEMALDYASSNPYRYYYCEDPDIDTPLEELHMIGKSISIKMYNELDEMIRYRFDIISLEDVENIDEANEYAKDNISLDEEELRDIIKFRKIIESNDPEYEKENKFNKLIQKSQYLMNELDLDIEDDLSLYEQYLEDDAYNEKMNVLYPMPHAWVLVQNGVKTIEDVRVLTDEELLSLSDIGPKRLAEIRKYLDSIVIEKEV